MSGRSPLRDGAELVLFRAGAAGLRALPSGVRAKLGRRLGRLYLRLVPSRRRILFENLARAYPEKSPPEIASIGWASAEWVGAAFVDFLDVSRLPAEEVRDQVRLVVQPLVVAFLLDLLSRLSCGILGQFNAG